MTNTILTDSSVHSFFVSFLPVSEILVPSKALGRTNLTSYITTTLYSLPTDHLLEDLQWFWSTRRRYLSTRY